MYVTNVFFLLGFDYGSAVWKRGGSAETPPAGSKQNHQDKDWQKPCWSGWELQTQTGT